MYHTLFFHNANGIQVVDLDELSNTMVKRDLRLTGFKIWPFPFWKGVILCGELATGGWGTKETELGKPRGAVFWSLHINNSKNASKRSLVREMYIYTLRYISTYIYNI